jgi:hypothetical protein
VARSSVRIILDAQTHIHRSTKKPTFYYFSNNDYFSTYEFFPNILLAWFTEAKADIHKKGNQPITNINFDDSVIFIAYTESEIAII